jgi:hypothetical protein
MTDVNWLLLKLSFGEFRDATKDSSARGRGK